MTDAILRLCVTATLYLLASPVYLVLFLRRVAKNRRIAALLQRGFIPCPYDATPIPLARMNTCSCGYVSPSALVLVPCELCGEVPQPSLVQCPSCGASVRVEVP